MITGCFSIGKIGDTEIFRITQTQFIPLHYQQNEERISEVRKVLNSGTFYFSWYSGSIDGTKPGEHLKTFMQFNALREYVSANLP